MKLEMSLELEVDSISLKTVLQGVETPRVARLLLPGSAPPYQKGLVLFQG